MYLLSYWYIRLAIIYSHAEGMNGMPHLNLCPHKSVAQNAQNWQLLLCIIPTVFLYVLKIWDT